MNWLPDWTVHPGEILGEWAAERRITGPQLALMTGAPVADVNAILRGAAPITADMADVLQTATGITAQLWLRMQESFDHHHSSRRR